MLAALAWVDAVVVFSTRTHRRTSSAGSSPTFSSRARTGPRIKSSAATPLKRAAAAWCVVPVEPGYSTTLDRRANPERALTFPAQRIAGALLRPGHGAKIEGSCNSRLRRRAVLHLQFAHVTLAAEVGGQPATAWCACAAGVGSDAHPRRRSSRRSPPSAAGCSSSSPTDADLETMTGDAPLFLFRARGVAGHGRRAGRPAVSVARSRSVSWSGAAFRHRVGARSRAARRRRGNRAS